MMAQPFIRERVLRPSLNAVPQATPKVSADPAESVVHADVRPTRERTQSVSARRHAGRSVTRALWILTICIAVAALRVGRELLVPMVLALLITLVLSGIVEFLRRYGVPRGLSAVVLLVLIGAAVGGMLHAVWPPAQQWIAGAPRVLRTIEHKTRPAQSVVRRIDAIVRRASALAGSGDPPAAGATVVAPSPPTVVSAMDVVQGTSGVVAAFVMGGALTLLLLAAGPATLARMTAPVASDGRAIHVLRVIEAIRLEVGRYYGTLAVINLGFGAITALVMWLLGMPNPMLWGALAGVLNFIPYLGCASTLAILTIVAFVSFDRISQTVLVAASFLMLAAVEGHLVEPIFLGRRLDLNPIVVLVALWVGAWVWGIAGVVVALPILLATKVAAAHSNNGGAVVRFLSPPRGRPERTWPGRFTRRT
jgi:predicted PurR-regulated permease PerM